MDEFLLGKLEPYFIVRFKCIQPFNVRSLALLYYETAGPLPSEGVVKRFYSLSGFILEGRRYNLDDENTITISLKHLNRMVESRESQEHLADKNKDPDMKAFFKVISKKAQYLDR